MAITPAEETEIGSLCLAALCSSICSAIGDLQMLPVQTKTTLNAAFEAGMVRPF
jgi:hypothetical protein